MAMAVAMAAAMAEAAAATTTTQAMAMAMAMAPRKSEAVQKEHVEKGAARKITWHKAARWRK